MKKLWDVSLEKMIRKVILLKNISECFGLKGLKEKGLSNDITAQA